jgi:glucosylceramidase
VALTDAGGNICETSGRQTTGTPPAYYDPGIGYSFARTTIHSCDFPRITYIKKVIRTHKFQYHHDRQYRIPFIKAIAAAGGKLKCSKSMEPSALMKAT